MTLREISIPSGGRAWVRTRLSHERHSGYTAVMAGLMTLLGRVQRINEQIERGEITEQATLDMRSITRQMADAKAEIVELCTQRWEGIRDPDNPDIELAFPVGIGSLDEEDFEALFNGCLAGVSEGRVDPKAGPVGSGGTSSSPSTSPSGDEKPGQPT